MDSASIVSSNQLHALSLSEIAVKPAFRRIDGVSLRFVASDQRNAHALLLPWPESVLGYDAI
jgi:hypothetical protein